MSRHQRQVHKRQDELLPYAVIHAATTGDPDAINAVLHHYSNYITRMSLRTLYDEQGKNCFLVLKRWRGIATRYAKTFDAFIAAVQIRCIAVWATIRSLFV